MTAAIPMIALVGNPNAGKSSLFNALTGARQKIANYPGVTVERKAGHASFADGRPMSLVDLPGSYSLTPASPDEAVTRDVVLGQQAGERRPDALIVVVDAANLDNHLCFALELIALGLPTVVALNMLDLAERDGLTLDPAIVSRELGVPVVPTVAVRKRGLTDLLAAVDGAILSHQTQATAQSAPPPSDVALHQRARNRPRRDPVRSPRAPLDAARRCRAAPSRPRLSDPARADVRDVSGRLCLVRSADRLDRGRHRRLAGRGRCRAARRLPAWADH